MYKAYYKTKAIRASDEIKYVKIRFNNWDELPRLVGTQEWNNIAYLDIYNQQIDSLPKTAGYWPVSLRKIYLGKNNISKLPDVPDYWPANLREIRLSSNNIKYLPESVNYWPRNMSAIYLRNNNLETLPKSPDYWPRGLSVLDISDNFIDRLPVSKGYWPSNSDYGSMMFLNISHNNIAELPENLLELKLIIKFIFHDNPIQYASSDIKQWLGDIKLLY